jgi:type II restriction/modification system DNA methylase subunit YeeA
MNPQAFVSKWRRTALSERSAVQQHFLDLCALVGHPPPAEYDPTGQYFAFEMGVDKTSGGAGWADVAKLGFFGWEYKGKHADLDKAYQQLLQYREALQNPPLLVVSDTDRLIIHTNFTNTPKRTLELTLDDLLTAEGLRQLRAIFFEPEAFRPRQTVEQVTEQAAVEFSRLATLLHKYGAEPHQAAHFLIRLLFVLFAEDIGLLPRHLLRRLAEQTRQRPADFSAVLRQLFAAMSTGGYFGADRIPHINGGLFDNATVLDLDSDSLSILAEVSTLDWSSIEPSIFGTLFERSLDPTKRAQLGAHYTGKDDILLIVEPVLMAPLRRRWEAVRAQAGALAAKRDAAKGKPRDQAQAQLRALFLGFDSELAAMTVLDPACGSGNFLYVALQRLLDLEKEVIRTADEMGVGGFFPTVSPAQVHGIELNDYAFELAQTTIWIGYIQWLQDNGYGFPSEPILKPLSTVQQMDAILAYDADGKPVEPEWPAADVIVGNPPFLGDKRMRTEMGHKLVEDLRKLYLGRLPGQSDLCCYWFEKSRSMIELGKVKRVGLLATQGIRGGANRLVLDRIKKSGDIFWAQSDRRWVLDGAMVHVSMVGFDDGKEAIRHLDNQQVTAINADLTTLADLTTGRRLAENSGIAFVGDTKKGKFDITEAVALIMLSAPINPNGRPNSDVIRRWINAYDVVQRPRRMWIIDFGVDTPQADAAPYEQPFEYVRQHVKPVRDSVRNAKERSQWWIHGRPAADLRAAVAGLSRFIVTPVVSKHRLFAWTEPDVLPDHAVCILAREDDFFFGVLQSSIHELWARGTGTQLREAESGFRYSQTMTFETFPFPFPPGHEPADDPRVKAIAEAARQLVQQRDAWLNPPDASEAELKKRTLTNLYNARPTWLANAHRQLDTAVFAAYGWPASLTDDEILARLLALNLERAAAQGTAAAGSERDNDE